ncbi:hypothetical protein VP01_1218g1 [Puccinia sorghi]|uniref:Uncharacterized protein n=1 Tax=Puccinia sorghi TaxID=27349 RepID=A0A0L6VQ77_9BASI|nr:hypothetical protein VP01_1218g1 [Puccinia sorghi]
MDYIYRRQTLTIRIHLSRQETTRRIFGELFRKQRQEEEEGALLFVALACLGGPVRQLRRYLTRANLAGNGHTCGAQKKTALSSLQCTAKKNLLNCLELTCRKSQEASVVTLTILQE